MKYRTAPDLDEIGMDEAAKRTVKSMEFLALCADIEQAPPPPPEVGSLKPADYGELTGKLICKACDRPIREHEVAEWHTVGRKR